MVEISLIMLAAIIILLYLLLRFGIIKRRVIVTIVENLPIGIFRDKNKSYEIENKVYIKELKEDKEELKKDSNENSLEGKDHLEENEDIDKNNNGIVYWTPNGKTYHNSKSCFALSRSKVINEGTIEESGKDSLCDFCKDHL